MTKKSGRSKKSKVPISWRIISVLLMLPLGAGIFYTIFRKSGGRLPLQAGDSTDPLFFSSVFAMLIPAILYLLVVEKVLRGIAAKRSGGEIAAEVAKDIGRAAAEAVLSGGSSDDRRSSSGGGTSGGGGSSGGGGASGGY